MRHDWIHDVLADLRDYAERNQLPATARIVADALTVARAETAPGVAAGVAPGVAPAPAQDGGRGAAPGPAERALRG